MGVWTPGPGATTGDDLFTGDGTAEVANGGDGNDTLNGNGGIDNLIGGNGNDTLNGGDNDDSLTGGAGDDTLNGGDGADYISDYETTNGAYAIDGGAGDDVIDLGNVSSNGFNSGSVDGGSGSDQLYAYGNFGSITFTGIEFLNTTGSTIFGSAAQFESFDTIRRDPSSLTTSVSLVLTSAGTLDLTDELLGRAASFQGSSGNDVITTSDGADTIQGLNGNDQLFGGAGGDALYGQAGDDALNGGDGNDSLFDDESATGVAAFSGGAGDDTIYMSNVYSSGSVDGGADADNVTAWGSFGTISFQNVEFLYTNNNLVTATAAQLESFDTIQRASGNSGSVSLTLSAAGTVDLADELLGRTVTFNGSSGADGITTSNGNDSINGNAGDDTIAGGLGTDTISGNDDNDTLYGDAGGDNLSGGNGNDTLYGGADNDTLNGNAGDDSLFGGDGADTLNDTQTTNGVVSFDAGAGNDAMFINNAYSSGTVDGGADSDTLDAWGNFGTITLQNVETLNTQGNLVTATAAQMESFDTIRYNSGGLANTVQLTLSEAGVVDLSDELSGRGVIFNGSSGDDGITLSNVGSQIYGNGGNDTIVAGSGNDYVIGGAGDDTLSGGGGDDYIQDDQSTSGVAAISGGAGADDFYVANAMSSGSVDGGSESDVLYAWGNLGTLTTVDVEILATSGNVVTWTAAQFEAFGSIRYDEFNTTSAVQLTLSASATIDLADELLGRGATFNGASGADHITLSNGNDTIFGNDGADTLYGADGADSLTGGAGLDLAYGQGGNDTFTTTAAHFIAGEIYDGGDATDQLRLSGVGSWDLRTVTISSLEALTFQDGAADNVHLVEINASQIGAGLSATAQINGDNLTDDQIRVHMATPGSIDMSGWTFTNWGANGTIDRVVVQGGSGADTISATRFNDELLGGNGDDLLEGGRGDDVINGGAGNDTATYASSTLGVIVGLVDFATYNTVGAGTDILIGVENLIGSNLNDALSGNAFANTLNGGLGDDYLAGAGGADTLLGGAGRDVAGYAFASTSASWHRNMDGTWTITGDGVDTLTSVEFADFTDRDLFLDRAESNFSGDGASDILLRRTSDGVTAIWSMAAGGLVTSANVTAWQAPTDWTIAAIGDFNGDTRDDFLLRRISDGVTSIWSMNGTNVIAADVTLWQAGLNWEIQGVGDFDGDARDDILWRRDDGVTAIWHMDGTNVVSSDVTNWQAGLEWSIAGIADFSGDGQDDLLLRRDDGVTAIWQMDGATVAAAGITGQQAGLDWQIQGVGDFNRDGRHDILIRNDAGVTAVWMMDGTSVTQSGVTSDQLGLEWSVAAVGDYNGDGTDDILWRDGDGDMLVWTMDGFNIASADDVTQQAGTEWGVI